MKHTKLLVTIVASFVIPVGSYIIFKKRTAKKLQWYTTAKPNRKDLTQYITAAGRLQAQDQITVGSLVAGRIIKLHVDDNDFVKKGQVLAELDDGIGYSAVKKAKASLAQASANLTYIESFYKRQKTLHESGQLAKDTFEGYTKDYETAQAQVLLSEGSLEIAQKNYNNLFIKAPEDGIIISKKVDLGQMVTAQFEATALFVIAKNLQNMEAEIDIDESDIGLVKIGQDAVFTVDAFPQKPFSSKIKQINYDYRVIENVVTYAIILDVDNPKLTLRPGMTTNVDIKVAQAENALCIPNKALRINKTILNRIAKKENLTIQALPETFETKSKDSLWIIEDKKAIKQVHVILGVASGKYRQIISGVTPDTVIIVEALDPERENPVFSMGKMKV
ncbi:efflux RND transporter periplasmic adaptor subunit [Candidatus Dependentiae bacterium]|nr:efflux RND transporter periplasmic adaptor subunit [Candidatus Dependentiae bacterium]